jgi:hypothetical protein
MGEPTGHPFRGNQYTKGGRVTELGAGAGMPPSQPWKKPPKPKGKPGGQAGGFSSTGKTNTEVGDVAEKALTKFGLEDAHPGRRQGPLDVTCCKGEWGFEVKAVTTESSEYKVKMKGHEQKGKIDYAKSIGVKPATMVVVMDYKKGVAHAYWKEGIGNFRLNPKVQGDWKFMGSVSVK